MLFITKPLNKAVYYLLINHYQQEFVISIYHSSMKVVQKRFNIITIICIIGIDENKIYVKKIIIIDYWSITGVID